MFTTNVGPKMELPQDLKNYRPSEDAFQLIEPDQALFCLIFGSAALGFFFGGW